MRKSPYTDVEPTDTRNDEQHRWQRIGLIFASATMVSWLVLIPVGFAYYAGEFEIILKILLIGGILFPFIYWTWYVCINKFIDLRGELSALITIWAVVSMLSALLFNGASIFNCMIASRYSELLMVLPFMLLILFQGLTATAFSIYAWKLPRAK